MTISKDLESKILRYHFVDKWRCGTIARQLQVHPDTVRRVLAQAGQSAQGPRLRTSMLDPYLPFIRETLENVNGGRKPCTNGGVVFLVLTKRCSSQGRA